jgi:HEPN domain-containing protein
MTPPEALPADWLQRARADLKVAQLIASDDELPAWPAGFHLQQAAEKAFKAVIVAHGRPAPRTHDLEQLAESVAQLEPSLAGWADSLLGLNEFGVAQRYPGVDEPAIDLVAAAALIGELIAAAQRVCEPAQR